MSLAAIRWDTSRMSELAAGLEAKAQQIDRTRSVAHEALARGDSTCDLRMMAIASLWADHGAGELRARAKLLASAENTLLWDLDQVDPSLSNTPWRPTLRARSIEVVANELDTAHDLAAGRVPGTVTAGWREARIAALTLELAVATRADAVMAVRRPESSSLRTLDRLIDFLSYEIAKSAPRATADWVHVAEATAAIRRHLNESWFSDVGRSDLIAITNVLGSLGGVELDLVVAGLSDAELYRWFRELDGIRGGNLDAISESELFAMVAKGANVATLFRLAMAEHRAKFAEVAAAVQRHAPKEVAMEFIEVAAASAASSDESLIVALGGLAALRDRERRIVMAALHRDGLLAELDAATKGFIARQSRERDDPVIIEFFEGLLGALGGTVKTIADLSIVGLVDSHRFRESWSRLAKILVLIPTDPIQFAAVVFDVDTFSANPARWFGAASAAVFTVGLSRLARLGRLGILAKGIADWVKRFGSRVVARHRNLELERGHVMSAIERLHDAADAAAARAVINDVLLVENYSDQLDDLVSSLADLEPATAIRLLQAMAQAASSLIERVTGSAVMAAAR